MVRRRPPKSGFPIVPLAVCGIVTLIAWGMINPQIRDKVVGLIPGSKSAPAKKVAEVKSTKAKNAAKESGEADPFQDETEGPGVASLETAAAEPASSEPLRDNIDNPFEEEGAGETTLVSNEVPAVAPTNPSLATDPFSDFETGEAPATVNENSEPELSKATPEEPAAAPKLADADAMPAPGKESLKEAAPPRRRVPQMTEAPKKKNPRQSAKPTASVSAERGSEDFEAPVVKPKRKISQLAYEESREPQELDIHAEDLKVEEPEASPQEDAAGEIAAEDDPGVDLDLRVVREMIKNGEESKAHRILSGWYWKFPENRELFQEELEGLAQQIYFSPQPHYEEPYLIQAGDRLSHIAEEYQVSWRYLSKLNHVDPKKIRAGKKLKVFQGPFTASIDLSDFELTIHHNGLYVKKYKIGIGKQNSTPIGEFVVRDKLENPTYYGVDGNVVDAEDPLNPLGERWIDIGDGFGIHGTMDPQSIGAMHSKGCIRMLNSDVEEVYDLLTLGSSVKIQR